MPVESPAIWKDLNTSWPTSTDACLEGDNHIRLLKQSLLIPPMSSTQRRVARRQTRSNSSSTL